MGNVYDEAIELAELARELGNTGPSFASTAKELADCNQDVDCMLDALPPPFEPFKEQFPDDLFPAGGCCRRSRGLAGLQCSFTTRVMACCSTGSTPHRVGGKHLTDLFFELWDANKERDGFLVLAERPGLPKCGNVLVHMSDSRPSSRRPVSSSTGSWPAGQRSVARDGEGRRLR